MVNILLVEDNEGDILLTTEALQMCRISYDLAVVKDGKDAVDFLSGQGRYSGIHTPDLILLDINLPKMNGYEVLNFIRENEVLKEIPVVVLTTSSNQKDIILCDQQKADGFITKPMEPEIFLQVLAQIREPQGRDLSFASKNNR
ncbi:MAG: response regulator [Chitinophagaceae bacterium]|nr:MAG: response regulator [Chitinophagaceae bacterium]